MQLANHPRLLAAALLAIPLSFGFAWLAASRAATRWRAGLLGAASCFALVHSLPPLAGLAIAVIANGAFPLLTERERLGLYLYEPVWLLGGLLLATAATVTWRETAA